MGSRATDAQVCAAKTIVRRRCSIRHGPNPLALKDRSGADASTTSRPSGLAPGALDEAQALPAKLDEATRLLGEGRTKMTTCDGQLAGLGVKYGF